MCAAEKGSQVSVLNVQPFCSIKWPLDSEGTEGRGRAGQQPVPESQVEALDGPGSGLAAGTGSVRRPASLLGAEMVPLAAMLRPH